jgi:hypothetical protein
VSDGAAGVEFTPVAVEGASGVTTCRITPDEVVLGRGHSQPIRVPLESIAEYRWRAWSRMTKRLGLGGKLHPVGERDWCQPEGRPFYRFFTQPPLVVYLPAAPRASYGDTLFARINETLSMGGFSTHDLA